MGAENIGNIKITSISLISNSQVCVYMLRVYTKDKIRSIHAKAIRQAWYESISCRKRRLEIRINEIRIYLKKGDSVQKYIDCISGIINNIKYHANHSGKLNLKQRLKHMKLKKVHPSKVYVLADRMKMTKYS